MSELDERQEVAAPRPLAPQRRPTRERDLAGEMGGGIRRS
jgi:hypothetical protein